MDKVWIGEKKLLRLINNCQVSNVVVGPMVHWSSCIGSLHHIDDTYSIGFKVYPGSTPYAALRIRWSHKRRVLVLVHAEFEWSDEANVDHDTQKSLAKYFNRRLP